MTDWLPVRDLLDHYIGGGWGSEESGPDLQSVAVIRGADFPSIDMQDPSGLPVRFETIRRVASRALQQGDIVLEISGGTKDRPTGRSVFVSGNLVRRAPATLIPASFCRLLRPKASLIDPRYLYYWLRGMYAEGRTWGYQVQSTGLANFQMELFLDRELVRLPPLPEQRRIAGVLGALDDLIEVNRELIRDLGHMASAIFDHLKPSASETEALSNVSDHLAGKYLAKTNYESGGEYTVYGSNSIMGTHHAYLHEGPLSVLARIGSYCGALAFSENNAWINNNASAIRAKDPANAYWIHQALTRLDMDLHRAGSGQPFIRIESLMAASIPWPPSDVLREAGTQIGICYQAIDDLERENAELKAARDDLLPSLMSGRVSVRKVAA